MKKRISIFILAAFTAASMLLAQQEDGTVSLRIMTYNIRHGAGMDDVLDLDRQARVIQDAAPDVVGLQEVDSMVKRTGYINETGILAKSLGMYGTFGPAIPLTGGKYGVAILSKERPLSVRNIPLPGKEARTLLVCEFREYVFACTHLDLEEANRLTSVTIITEEAARWDKPFFICGDWNDYPTSTLISKMKRSFVLLNNITNNPANYTFPAGKPTSIIDYIASYGRIARSVRNRKVINEPEASDHRPVTVDVKFDGYTGIQAPVSPVPSRYGGEAYDLSGRKVAAPFPPGLYIVGGKKVVAK